MIPLQRPSLGPRKNDARND
ncbi:hypothetical protein Godav_023184, partial [Gossypium davidsonii]|nr:hypothetical protein [Gossypium davidsonii]